PDIHPLPSRRSSDLHLSVSGVGIPARLQPLSLQLEPGDRLLVQGPSGSGKSTLIHALLGFLPYQGELLINGQPLHSLDRSAWHRSEEHTSELQSRENLVC